MKIFPVDKIREWDAYTIANEPISSLDLMERASLRFVEWFTPRFDYTQQQVKVLVGPGNNGGDGLAIARMLHRRFYEVAVFLVPFGKRSSDFEANLKRLPKDIPCLELEEGSVPFFSDDILIDALLGSGLSRPLSEDLAAVANLIKMTGPTIISVDIPSGLFADRHTNSPCIHTDYTLSFQAPKLAFLLPENASKVGEWHYVPIGLSLEFAKNEDCDNYYITQETAKKSLLPRKKFSHKGSFGHALLVAGSYGKTGAAILAAEACLRSGAGLLTTHLPQASLPIMQTALPEAMCVADRNDLKITQLGNPQKYTAIGIGPGLGTDEATAEALHGLLNAFEGHLVLDADALNILSRERDLLDILPQGSILTPHPKEFERLFGKSENDWERMEKARQEAMSREVHIVLKGAHTCIALADGTCHFNSTGNPGMATAGSGDVLTGIITGLLAQGYASDDAAILGVYLHGLAGDIAAAEKGQRAMLASDITAMLGRAYAQLEA